MSKAILRQSMRTYRRNLDSNFKGFVAQKIASSIIGLVLKNNFQHILLYMDFDSEVATDFLIKELWALEKKIYLPVVDTIDHSNKQMLFVEYLPTTDLSKHKYGMLQPKNNSASSIEQEQLELICMPLLAFDQNKYRLGSGGGYYDYTFAKKNKDNVFCGLAYSGQEVDSIQADPWDIPMDYITTENGIR